MLLEPWSDDVWTVAVPHTMLGIHLGTRMTVDLRIDADLEG